MPYPPLHSLLGRSTLVLLALFLQAQTPTPSEDAHPIPLPHHIPTLSELIADLHSPIYSVRENASTLLIQLPPDRRSEIEAALANEKDEEAIARLTKIATHMYLKEQTPLYGKVALLGILFHLELIHMRASNEMQMSVAVSYLHPGFPAAEVLKPGDRLIAVNGTHFSNTMEAEDFRAIVNPKPLEASGNPDGADAPTTPSTAGTIMNFTIIRDGHELQIGVQLAGIPDSVVGRLDEYIMQRTALAEDYANSLKTGKTGKTSKPMVVGVGSPENP